MLLYTGPEYRQIVFGTMLQLLVLQLLVLQLPANK